MESNEPSRLLLNWKAERDSAALYQGLAAIERNESFRGVFDKLAASEREHSTFWEERLRAAGHPVPPFNPSLRGLFAFSRAINTDSNTPEPQRALAAVNGLITIGDAL